MSDKSASAVTLGAKAGIATPDTFTDTASTETVQEEPTTTSDETEVGCCPECDGEDLVEDQKENHRACQDCGEIFVDSPFKFDPTYRQRSAIAHTKETQITNNNTSGVEPAPIGGKMDYAAKDGYGNFFSARRRTEIHRLRELDKAIDTSDQRTTTNRFGRNVIARITGHIETPDYVRERAFEIFKDALEADLLTGRSVELVAAASTALACEENGFSVNDDELESVAGEDGISIEETASHIEAKLEIGSHSPRYNQEIVDVCAELPIDHETERAGLELFEVLRHGDTADTHREEVHAAVAVYTAALKANTQISIETLATEFSISLSEFQECYQSHLESLC